MYVVVTKNEQGYRRHYIVEEETGKKINEYFTNFQRAEKSCRRLNKEAKREMRIRLQGDKQ